MEILRINNVWVYYGETLVLKDVSLNIEIGDFLGLIGPNGGGKTTLLKVILGLIKPDRGMVEVFGLSPEKLGKKRHLIGYLPQRSLADWQFPVTVLDVVMMGRYGQVGILRQPSSRDKDIALQALERVGVAELAQRMLTEISIGQQQRVFIARALATNPKLLLLDEPGTGIDAPAQSKFYQFLEELKEDLGLTIIMVSHDFSVITTYAGKIACLNQSLYLHTHPAEIFTSGSLQKVYGCEIELLAHGPIPHRVVEEHEPRGSSRSL